MDKLSGMTVFVKVVEEGSFTAASHALECSTSYVSKEITKLEKRLGARLLNRSTRTLSLTDSGNVYYERAKQIVEEAESLEKCVNINQNTPSGLLKISIPVTLGHNFLKEKLAIFLKKYPDIQLEVDLSDRKVDVITEGFDLVIRATAEMKDSSLIVKKWMTSHLVTFASPEYLEKNGTPKTPEDLANHACMSYSLMETPNTWDYFDKEKKKHTVKVKSRYTANSSSIRLEAAKHHLGISRLPYFACDEELKNGTIVPILEEYEQTKITIYIVYPHKQYLPAKTRAFIDFLMENG